MEPFDNVTSDPNGLLAKQRNTSFTYTFNGLTKDVPFDFLEDDYASIIYTKRYTTVCVKTKEDVKAWANLTNQRPGDTLS